MNTLASFLVGIAGTLAGRVLIALGIGWVSYSGIQQALDTVRTHITTAWGAGGPVMDIMYMAGMGEAAGIILTAITIRATLYGISRLGKITQ